MRATTLRIALIATLVWATPNGLLAQSTEALNAYRSGRYEDAIAMLEAQLRGGSIGSHDARILVRALRDTGQLERALAAAEAYAAGDAVAIASERGEVLLTLGRDAQAETEFQRAIDGQADDHLMAALHLAVLQFETGRRDQAMVAFDRFIDVYNERTDLGASDLLAVGVACTYLGIDDPQLFHDAVRALDEAIAAAPSDPEPRVRLGELFLAKYDAAEAGALIAEALRLNPRHPRALLADAQRALFNGEPEVMARVDAALAVNPSLIGAHALRARLLLSGDTRERAIEATDNALRVNPAASMALSVRAAAQYLQGDTAGFEASVARALQRNPHDGDFFNTVADLAVQNRLYRDAVDLAARGVEVDPTNWPARGTLGINQLRIGLMEEGRSNLETAFAGDPFNVWIKNTLDLADTYETFVVVETPRFEFVLPPARAEVVALYMQPLAEEALATLSSKYGFTPPPPLRVEVYDRHADFSVRTVGLAGIGALGVAFGPVIAVDAPVTPGMGEYNWGSTLWHEIAHVVTLGATDNRIPRWLTEGLSVYEERRAREGWGDDATPGFLSAFANDQLLPVSRIDEGFLRPRYPQHLGHSYFQASLVCEFIEENHGFEAIRGMLDGYRRRMDTAAIVREVLDLEPEELDRRFDAYVRERYAGPLRGLASAPPQQSEDGEPPVRPAFEDVLADADANAADFLAQMRAGAGLVERGEFERAEPYLERAKRLFPGYGGDDSAYVYLARVYRSRADWTAVAHELGVQVSLNENDYDSHLALADALEAIGRTGDAADALARAQYIDPYQTDVHTRLAELYETQGRWSAAVRERRALVALDPVDRAGALYGLARALHGGGEVGAARRAVLQALEIAPGYAPAQDLLLTLRSETME